MKTIREMVPELTLSQNFRLALSEQNLTFRDLAERAKVGQETAYRAVEKPPLVLTDQVLRIGKILGFDKDDIRERIRAERAIRKVSYSKKGRLYELISEIIELFEKERR